MPHFLSEGELDRTAPAEIASFSGPIPTQIVSNGEFNPLPQTRDQQRVETRIDELAVALAPKHGMSRRQFWPAAPAWPPRSWPATPRVSTTSR